MAADDDPRMDRQRFLRVAWSRLVDGAARGAGAALDSVADRLAGDLLRPPGALSEADFLLACTRCDLCIEACPHDSLVRAGAREGAAAGTPHVVAARIPCYLCDDLPCISACPDGALVRPEGGKAGVRMGLAELSPRHCLAVAGDACDICVQCCPFPGVALWTGAGGAPIVDPDQCTGCGICQQVCPSRPAALSVRPIRGSHQTQR